MKLWTLSQQEGAHKIGCAVHAGTEEAVESPQQVKKEGFSRRKKTAMETCACGCGLAVTPGKKWRRGHQRRPQTKRSEASHSPSGKCPVCSTWFNKETFCDCPFCQGRPQWIHDDQLVYHHQKWR